MVFAVGLMLGVMFSSFQTIADSPANDMAPFTVRGKDLLTLFTLVAFFSWCGFREVHFAGPFLVQVICVAVVPIVAVWLWCLTFHRTAHLAQQSLSPAFGTRLL